jgi:nicotinamide-nucleotide amidase
LGHLSRLSNAQQVSKSRVDALALGSLGSTPLNSALHIHFMHLEVINTGTELLLGHTINTHLAYIGERLLPLGLRIARQLCLPDGDVIRTALEETFGRADIVLVTGGLGPTSDDITREITAELLGLPLAESESVKEAIRARLARRNRELNANTLRQAMVPAGAEVLHNTQGTAPGLYFPPQTLANGIQTPHIFLLPGPPRELKPMMQLSVEPKLIDIGKGKLNIQHLRNFRLCNIGESEVERTVENPIRSLGDDVEIGYCAKLGEVVVRVLGSLQQLESARMIIASAFPNQYFSDNDDPLNFTAVKLLQKLGRTVSTAESCTGGAIGHAITNVSGSSAVFTHGFLTYANEAKTQLLGVPADMIAAHGAVSEPVCAAMAAGCLKAAGTDYAVSATGIAGPGGGSEEKPVGTVFIGLAGPGGLLKVEKHVFPMERQNFKNLVAILALDLLRRNLV